MPAVYSSFLELPAPLRWHKLANDQVTTTGVANYAYTLASGPGLYRLVWATSIRVAGVASTNQNPVWYGANDPNVERIYPAPGNVTSTTLQIAAPGGLGYPFVTTDGQVWYAPGLDNLNGDTMRIRALFLFLGPVQ